MKAISRSAYPILLFLLFMSLPLAALAENGKTSTQGYKKHYTFTENWFGDRIPTWTQELKEFKDKPDVHYLEIGTFEGRSALWVLENILTQPTSKITIIDAFEEGKSYETFMSNVKLSGESDKFKILKGTSTEKLREIPLDSFDFAYVDGSGEGIVMLSDLVSTWNLVKVGGIIICSRYGLDKEMREDLELKPHDPGPHEAIDTFLKVFKPYVTVLAFQDNQVFIRKQRGQVGEQVTTAVPTHR
jgi:hypothetical protein